MKNEKKQKLTSRQIRLKVFALLCKSDLEIMCGWIPCSCPYIARTLNISLYQCRKHMKALVEEGLAVRGSVIIDREESLLPYNGFHVSEKGKDTDIYMYCALKEARILAECFNGRVEYFLPKNFDMRWYPEGLSYEAHLYQI